MSQVFDDSDDQLDSPAWEPEPLELPIDAPCVPERDRVGEDSDEADTPSGVIVIDLC